MLKNKSKITKINDAELKKLSNCIRFLSIDAIERSNSGHPGMPMGMADVATILFTEFLRFDTKNPHWHNRDRFILSAGHGSMLLYSLLYLCGYEDISMEDIKHFRQLNQKCAGHPEYGHLKAIETTTGPLGQGLANAVGMAVAEQIISSNILDKDIINHKTYCIVGDGCLMEGISQEAISLAGHLNLNKLIVLWDNNSISIDGDISIASSENMQSRFEACDWKVIKIDGHNFSQIRKALKDANKSTKPVLIDCKTIIAFGSPNKSGSSKSHGSPLGASEVEATRKNLNWSYKPFEIPENLIVDWNNFGRRHHQEFLEWQKKFNNSEDKFLSQFKKSLKKEFPENLTKEIEIFKKKIFFEKPNQATRKSSQIAINFFSQYLHNFIGGSADLTESVLTKASNAVVINRDNFKGNYIHYGIREHLMGAMMNGMALYGGLIPFGGTFLVFSDYMKPAIRLSALMEQQVIYILTHDSIGLGEDGPTHQPIEHLAMLRAIPNLLVFRPADAIETLECFEMAIKSHNKPSAMILSRQNLPFLRHYYQDNQNLSSFGAYAISDAVTGLEPDVIIISTGSEVHLALEVKEKLHQDGLVVRVISMPSIEIFEEQSREYKEKLLATKNKNPIIRIAIEAGIEQGWHKFIGSEGIFVGMSSFGASGKAEDLYKHFKINADDIYKRIITATSKKVKKLK